MYSKICLCDKCGKTLGFGTYPPDDGSAFICVYTEGSNQLNISICKVCFVSVITLTPTLKCFHQSKIPSFTM